MATQFAGNKEYLCLMISRRCQFYFTPYDDAQSAFLAELSNAKKQIRIAIYSFNLPQAASVLIDKFKAGVDVALVMDSSQAAGPSERPEVAALAQAGIPLHIGNSVDHKILHDKFAVIDGRTFLEGSYNFTGTAQKENNVLHVHDDPEIAGMFLENWNRMRDYIHQTREVSE